MTAPVISVRDIGKKYRLGATLSHTVMRDAIVDGLKSLVRRRSPDDTRRQGAEKDFWALRGVSFDVQQGEAIGIIGRNGAGKSTLLKILSQITDPTEGEIRIRGRVASLLEVGTGFHPELSGRENIFLNGAILGMTHAEIRRKLDEIVAFAGVEKFLDTPVKRYSSGMYVRLAFAVAAHLEPEILLVDEVLAVGDAEFQRRCLGKMSDVARSGRTILFVSHNMAAIENLCRRAVLLVNGNVDLVGDPATVISRYLGSAGAEDGDTDLVAHSGRPSFAHTVLRRFRILNEDEKPQGHAPLGGDVCFEVSGDTPERLDGVTLNIRMETLMGQRVAVCHTEYQHREPISLQGPFRFLCRMRNCRLMPGPYHLSLFLKSARGLEDQIDGLSMTVTPRDVYGTGRVVPPRTGTYVPEATWHIET